jgi:hypothetical protein
MAKRFGSYHDYDVPETGMRGLVQPASTLTSNRVMLHPEQYDFRRALPLDDVVLPVGQKEDHDIRQGDFCCIEVENGERKMNKKAKPTEGITMYVFSSPNGLPKTSEYEFCGGTMGEAHLGSNLKFTAQLTGPFTGINTSDETIFPGQTVILTLPDPDSVPKKLDGDPDRNRTRYHFITKGVTPLSLTEAILNATSQRGDSDTAWNILRRYSATNNRDTCALFGIYLKNQGVADAQNPPLQRMLRLMRKRNPHFATREADLSNENGQAFTALATYYVETMRAHTVGRALDTSKPMRGLHVDLGRSHA